MAQDSSTDLVALTGTPKQVAWAEQIRTAWIEKAEPALAREIRWADDDELLAMWMAAVPAGRRQTSAVWWIETRAHRFEAIGEALASGEGLRVGMVGNRTIRPEFA